MSRRIAALAATVAALSTTLVATPAAQASESQGSWYYFTNGTRGGAADLAFAYGKPTDVVLVGDWDGDGVDTLGVRRGNQYHLTNRTGGGPADVVFNYGKASDVVLVGDWNGDGKDTLGVRRGREYHLSNRTTGGVADIVFSYGKATDVVLVGDWDGNKTSSLGVRRGREYHLTNRTTGGPADIVFSYGKATDVVLVGDWDGNGTSTLGVRRHAGPASIPSVSFADEPALFEVGAEVPAGLYKAPSTTPDCLWITYDHAGDERGAWIGPGPAYLEVGSTERWIEMYSGCGTWRTAFPADTPKIVPAPRDGQYRVGIDVAPGTYVATVPDDAGEWGCYVAALSDFKGTYDSILANYASTTPGESFSWEVYEDDAGFETNGCGQWTRVEGEDGSAPRTLSAPTDGSGSSSGDDTDTVREQGVTVDRQELVDGAEAERQD